MEKIKYLAPQLINKMQHILKNLPILIIALILSSNINADQKVEHKIAVLVNESVITSYDIIQRMKLTAITQGININEQNNQSIVNNVVDELIREKVKIEKINEYNITIEEKEYLEYEANFFLRNNINQSQISILLIENNVDYQELKDYLINELSWSKLISGLYQRFTSVSELEINELLSKNPNLTINQAKSLVIQRQLDLQSSKLLRDIMNEATIEYK